MRALFLTLGAPGSGKSTWLKENGLDYYTLSPDALRLNFSSPVYDNEGRAVISQKNDKRVWSLLFELLEERMKNGDTTFIDATHTRSKMINAYRKLAKQYRYRVYVIDFRGIPIDEVLRRNRARNSIKYVPEEQIRKMYFRASVMNIPSWVTLIKPDEFDLSIKKDFTKDYDNIIAIGDIHGAYDELIKLTENISEFGKDSTFHIFLGDYFDRGKQNVEVYKWIKEKMDKPNFLFLTGNHELYLPKYGTDEWVKSDAVKRTFKEFENAGITQKDIKKFYGKLAQLAYFTFGRKDYLFTHGGLPTTPNILTSLRDVIYGTGKYADIKEIYYSFKKNTKNTLQFHGHRNLFQYPFTLDNVSYNLNGDAEQGGELRAVRIHNDGDMQFYTQSAINYEKSERIRLLKSKEPREDWFDKMLLHKEIKIKKITDDIVSLNFTRKAFYKRVWDDLTTKARGLYYDTKENRIVARGYDKFFNLNERDETKIDNLNRLKYPLVAYKKENGYLGILSVNKGDCFIATKTTTSSEYVDWFKEQLKIHLTEELKKEIETKNVTLLFEVIEPENDPHIIKYNKRKIVLLDVVKNQINEELLPYDKLVEFGNKYGFEIKEKGQIIDNYEQLYELINDVKNENLFEPKNKHGEGYVIIDSNGFKFKLKSGFYSFWKSMRGMLDAWKKRDWNKSTIEQTKHSLHRHEEMLLFDFYLKNKDKDFKSIIDFREQFLNQ